MNFINSYNLSVSIYFSKFIIYYQHKVLIILIIILNFKNYNTMIILYKGKKII